MTKPIIIAGHPYAFPYYFKVFEYLTDKNKVIFVLPKLWLAKKGKVRIKLEPKSDFTLYGLRTVSYGGHGLKGLFKGFLPGIFFLLPYLRIKYKSKIFYSCSEPNLLTTFFNGCMAKFCGMKYFFFTWQNIPPEKYMSGIKLNIYLLFFKLNLCLADGVICGNTKAGHIIKKFQPGSKTIISPLSGVDVEKFKPGIEASPTGGWREKLAIKSEEKLILFYGALDVRKGVSVLITAFQGMVGNCKLLIVGTGPEKDNLQRQAASGTNIIFLDWMPNAELPALLNAADVFVYPSVPIRGWEEQFGYAMAEASACGVPVVATKIGSIEEVVIDNKTGFLVA